MKKLTAIFGIILVSFFLSGSCRSLKEPDFRSIENIRVSRFGLNESTLTLDLHYFNPNKTKLKLKEAEGDAWLNGTLLGHFIIDTLVSIPANGDFSLPVKLQIDMSKVFKNSLTAFLSNEVTVKVEGKARVGKGGIYIRYPIRYEGKQNLDKLIRQNDLKTMNEPQ